MNFCGATLEPGLETVRKLHARNIDLGRRRNRRVRIELEAKLTARPSELHAMNASLYATRVRAAEPFDGPSTGIWVARVVPLIHAVDRQVLLIPVVADAQVVAVRRGVVPLRRVQQQLIEGVVHEIERCDMRPPDQPMAIARGPLPIRCAAIEIVRYAELTDQCRRTAREPASGTGASAICSMYRARICSGDVAR